MIEYVEGLVFQDTEVLLILKDRGSDYIKGKWNGPGGKIEPGETPLQAMRREYLEETGLDLYGWQKRLTLYKPGECIVHFFAIKDMHVEGLLYKARTMESEIIGVHDMHMLPPNTVENLRWIIPFCMDDSVRHDTFVELR